MASDHYFVFGVGVVVMADQNYFWHFEPSQLSLCLVKTGDSSEEKTPDHSTLS